MDPRFLPFQIAAGILLAALVILMVKVGMNIHRNNASLRSGFGAVVFLGGIVLGWATLVVGFNY